MLAQKNAAGPGELWQSRPKIGLLSANSGQRHPIISRQIWELGAAKELLATSRMPGIPDPTEELPTRNHDVDVPALLLVEVTDGPHRVRDALGSVQGVMDVLHASSMQEALLCLAAREV